MAMQLDEATFVLDDAVGDGPSGPPAIKYNGSDANIKGLPTRHDLVRKTAAGREAAAAIETAIAARRPVFFMPNDVHEENEYCYGVPVYKLHLFGVLFDGSKAQVIIDGIDVYVDVRVPDGAHPAKFEQSLYQTILEETDGKIKIVRVDDVQAFPIHGYRETKVAWKRIFFHNVQARREAIRLIRTAGHETASDDRAHYFRLAARVNGIVLTDWATLSDYCHSYGGAAENPDPDADKSPLCEHVFRLDARDFKPLVDPMAEKTVRDEQEAAKARHGLARDKTLVMTWDIETCSTSKTGDVPKAHRDTDHVFMICATLHWKDEVEPLHRVCIVDIDTDPDERWTTIICESESNIIKVFALVFRHFAPDILTGFNDSDYDWPFILEKARRFGLLTFLMENMTALPRRNVTEEGVDNWNVVKDKPIKIAGEGMAAKATFLKVPGCVPVDTRTMFRKLFPLAEVGKGSSLKFYLQQCNLPPKADMPFKRMWEIYDARDTAQMRHVAHYCVIDAKSCQELLVARNVINERREVATLAFVSLFDGVYYADGHKVCNMLIAYAVRRGMLCSNLGHEDIESGKYPGAWVFHPEKGLVPDPKAPGSVRLEAARAALVDLGANADPAMRERARQEVAAALADYHPGRPTTGLDFSSLYPSIIMTYNLSPEKFIEDPAMAANLKAEGKELHHVQAQYNGRAVCGWFVRHGSIPDSYGLFPSILMDLFNKRAEIKKRLGVQEKLKEHMEVVMSLVQKTASADPIPNVNAPGGADRFATSFAAELEAQRAATKSGDSFVAAAAARNVEYMEAITARVSAGRIPENTSDDLEQAFQERYRETVFEFSAIDTKQKALKVFMNTFYGEAGNKRSPIFLLPLAVGVTTAGQYNIKKVYDFVCGQDFRVKYGDTDSLYVCAPERFFADVDRHYAFGEISKETYWTKQVEITMKSLDTLRDQVNAHLRADNGTDHLKMAYEEVLFPVVFTGKKKYFGIAHVNVVNFRPKKLFVRGIEVVKRGQSDLAKKIGNRIMWKAVSLENTLDLISVVEEVLREAVENTDQWVFDDFVLTAAWKPDKDNKSVQKFIARMRVRVAEEKNARREAVGLDHNKLHYIPSPGERFRYVLVKLGAAFNLRGLKIQPAIGDLMEYEEVAKARELPINVAQYLTSYVVGLCARFINYSAQFCPQVPETADPVAKRALDQKAQNAAKRYLTNFVTGIQGADPVTMRKRGYAYRRAWKSATLEYGAQLRVQLGPAAEVLLGEALAWGDQPPTEEGVSAETVAARAKSAAEAGVNAELAKFLVAWRAAAGIAPNGRDVGPDAKTAGRLFKAAQMLKPPARGRSPSLRHCIQSDVERRGGEVRARLATLLSGLADVAARYEAGLARAVAVQRAREHEARPAELGELATPEAASGDNILLEDGDKERLQEIRALWYRLIGVYRVQAQHAALREHLASLKVRRQRRIVRPPDAARTIAAAARNRPPLEGIAIGNGGY